MRSLRYVIAGLGTSLFASVLLASVVLAQEVDQSAAQYANATRSINQSTVIPAPEPTFGGSIDKKGGTGTLSVDGKTVARKHIDATVPFSYPIDDGFSVTSASATPLSHDYSVPFDFTGTLTSVTITLFPETLTPQERLKLEEGLGRDWLTVE